MGREILHFSARYIELVDVRVGERRIHAAGIDGLIIAAPRHYVPGVTGLLFMGQQLDLASAPVEQSNVILGTLLRLVGESNGAAIVGPVRILLANRRRIRQVNDLTTVARDSVEIPEFIACVVLLVDDPFAVGRPGSVVLPIVGLGKLNRPSAGGVDLPQIEATGNIAGKSDLLTVRRPGGAKYTLCVVKVVDGRRPGARV